MSGILGEREMLWEHEPQASVSTAFSSSPKLSQVFLNLIPRGRNPFGQRRDQDLWPDGI